ncbi:MAG: dockerin type I repeat-containing protein [Ruminococcus sp.]|nr:dockerin type I repeat-containing protein [Ruminococcus sp.]
MRKFTKEITALIASAAIGSAAGVSALSASSEEMLRTAGVDMLPDETICTTELPPTAGEPLPPDEFIATTTEEELPPLMGDIAPADGDVNGDGSLDIADVILLQKWLLATPDTHLDNWQAADLCEDGKLDVFDLCLMKRALIERSSESFVIPDGYIAIFHGNLDDASEETYIYKIDNGAANYGFKYINVERSSFNIYHTERVALTGQGEVMWTDDVFKLLRKTMLMIM